MYWERAIKPTVINVILITQCEETDNGLFKF